MSSIAKNDVQECKPLTRVLENDQERSIMQKKLTRVRNDGQQFMYFNSRKSYNNDKTYCYVNTFDNTKLDGSPECSKLSPVYNAPMFNSVELGAVMEKGDVIPRQVCIVEVDSNQVFSSDVANFATQVNLFDNKYMIENLEICKKDFEIKSSQYNKLLDEHNTLQVQAKQAVTELNQCTVEKNKLMQQSILQNAALDSLNNKVVIIDSRNVQSRIIVEVGFGVSAHPVPNTMQVGFVFMPPGFRVKFNRNDDSFFIVSDTDSSVIDQDNARNIVSLEVMKKE